MTSTTVRVSRSTLTELEKLRDELGLGSLDDAIVSLIRRHRADALQAALGVDKVEAFSEVDRGEDR